MSDFADHLLGQVRALLRQHPPFAGMTRSDLDDVILADLERSIRCDLEDWIAATEYEIRNEVEMDLEVEAEIKMAAEKAARTKPNTHVKQEERHADHQR